MWWLLNEAHKVEWEVLGVTHVMVEVDFTMSEGVVL